MKKHVALLLIFMMIMTLAACGSGEEGAPVPAQESAASEPAPQETPVQEEPAQEDGNYLVTGFENNIKVECDEGYTAEDASSWMEFSILKDGEEILRGMQSDPQQWTAYSSGNNSSITIIESTEDNLLYQKNDGQLGRMVKVSNLYVMLWQKPNADLAEEDVLAALNSVHFSVVE